MQIRFERLAIIVGSLDITILCLIITWFSSIPSVSGHGHSHHSSHHHAHAQLHDRSANSTTDGWGISLEEAKDIIAKFQESMATANAASRKNPRLNNYTVFSKTEVQQAVKPAPYLPYDTGNSTAARRLRRQLSNSTDNIAASGNSSVTTSYTIPPEVVEAARILAEANPPDTSSDKYDALVTSFKGRYAPKKNDTNVMPQVLQRGSGLFEYVGNVSGAESTVTKPGSSSTKRAAAKFWLENIAQLGSSPYAPSGYKVRETFTRHLMVQSHSIANTTRTV